MKKPTIIAFIIVVCAFACVFCACSERKVEAYVLSSNAFPTEYKVDAPLDLSGAFVVVTYNDGNSEKVQITPNMVTGFDTATTGNKTMKIQYNDYETEVSYRVYNPENSQKEIITKARLGLSAYYAPGDEYVEYTVTLEKEALATNAIKFTLNGDVSLGIDVGKSNLTLSSSLPSSTTAYRSELSSDGKSLALLIFNVNGETLTDGGQVVKIRIDKGSKTPVRLKEITLSDGKKDYYLPVSA